MTDLQRAIKYLGAERAGRGYYAYEARDEGRAMRYRLDADDMRALGALLRRDHPDAYSQWCAETMPERQPTG